MHDTASEGPEGSRAAAGRAARWLLLAALPLLAHCASAPRLDGVEATHAIPPADSTQLDQIILQRLGDEPGLSGVQLVQNNALAFAYRAGTAAAAERSLDVQYYLWQADFTGKLLAAELLRAAERGVKVRVLIDDLDARAKHDVFAIADLHPNVEVRIFNPFYDRYGVIGQWSEFVLRGTTAESPHAQQGMGRRQPRRHHRRAQHRRRVFRRVRAVQLQRHRRRAGRARGRAGEPRIRRVLEQSGRRARRRRFEARKPKPEQLQQLSRAALQFSHEAGETPYIAALRDPAQRAELLRRAPPLVRVNNIRVLADDPGKIGAEEAGLHPSLVLDALMQVVGQASSEVLVVSPYFVPGKQGAANLIEAAQRGIRVAVLTNSLAATDIVAVHVGYARYRRELLRGGVGLYEMKRRSGDAAADDHISLTGSSRATLHTKAMIVDRRWAFIGSMNLDPRSANLNTEMGVLVDSEALAEQLREQFERNTSPELSYRVELDPKHGLVWHDRVAGQDRAVEDEPDASVGRRLGATLLRALPMESQL